MKDELLQDFDYDLMNEMDLMIKTGQPLSEIQSWDLETFVAVRGYLNGLELGNKNAASD